jgi:MoaA/NifB/PqqE/SkfB family radical SAM enzyme
MDESAVASLHRLEAAHNSRFSPPRGSPSNGAMRFPLALTTKIAAHIVGHKLRRVSQFATVLQLEPLHTCNLTCTGCGRIREYSTSLKDVLPLADCLGAAEECNAPMVSICGGEPLIYPQIEALIRGLHEQKRIVYVCTNGTKMRAKMRDYLAVLAARQPALAEAKLRELLRGELITEEQAQQVRDVAAQLTLPTAGHGTAAPATNGTNGVHPKFAKRDPRVVISPSPYFYWNVHLDGLERTHDLIVEREGVFKECVAAIRMAKILGYQVATNTTVYKETDPEEIEGLFNFLATLNVDGHTISPGYDYDAAKRDMAARLGRDPGEFFLTRVATREKFARAIEWGKKYPILGTPGYLEFLAGKRELSCSAWAIPTRNVRGWKGPCYLMTDGHYATYAELLEKTDWSKLGYRDGKALDARCENCMVHCGYEPTAALGLSPLPGDLWKTIAFTFGAKPKPELLEVDAFDGVTSGRGHLTGKTAG